MHNSSVSGGLVPATSGGVDAPPVQVGPSLRRALLAASVALIVSGSLPAQVATMDAMDLEGAWNDRRWGQEARLSPSERADFARDYGLEAFLPPPGRGTVVVSNCNDNGAGSLRAAIASAASGDLVDLRNLTCSTISIASGEIGVEVDALTITGPGREQLTIRNIGAPSAARRIFRHSGTGMLQLNGLTLADGISAEPGANRARGGCVLSSGTVSLGNPLAAGSSKYSVDLRNCRASSVEAPAAGGGIWAERVVMINSTITGCSISGPVVAVEIQGGAGAFANSGGLQMVGSELVDNHDSGSKYGGGGALAASGGGTATSLIVGSTIAGNHSQSGGGLSLLGPARVVNSTLSGNTSIEGGAAVLLSDGLASGDLELVHSTIAGNAVAGSGAGVFVGGNGSLVLSSSIVAGNTRGNNLPSDVGGSGAIAGSHSLVRASTASQPLPADTVVGMDAGLWPLAWNGGATRTHALRRESPAIDLGANPTGEAYDQRGEGFPREIGVQPDIGALEFDPELDPELFADGFESPWERGR